MGKPLQYGLRFLFQPPKLREQILCGRRRLIAIEILVRQNLVARLRPALPANDRPGDFAFQECPDILAVRDVLVVVVWTEQFPVAMAV